MRITIQKSSFSFSNPLTPLALETNSSSFFPDQLQILHNRSCRADSLHLEGELIGAEIMGGKQDRTILPVIMKLAQDQERRLRRTAQKGGNPLVVSNRFHAGAGSHDAPSRLFKKLKQKIAFTGMEIFSHRSRKLVQTINHRFPIRCPDLLQSKNHLPGLQFQQLPEPRIRFLDGSVQEDRTGGTARTGDHIGNADQLFQPDRKNRTGTDYPPDPVVADEVL